MAAASGWLNRWLRVALGLEDALLVLILAVMIILAGLQILLRNIWDAGIVWGDPLLRVAVMWIGLLGAMAATRDRNHISIDVLSRFLPSRFKTANQMVTDLFSAVVCALLAYHGARFMVMDWEADTMAFATVPAWVCELIIPLGFGVMAVRFCLSLLLSWRS